MTDTPPSYQRFFAELKRRRVFRVMAVYGVVGFVLLQIVDLAVPALLLPEWTYRLVALILLIGFPVAVVIAWAFEMTPEGVQKTQMASPGEIEGIVSAPASQRLPAGLLALAGVVLLFGGGWWMGQRTSADRDLNLAVPSAQAADFQTIAVLPFENIGDDERNDVGFFEDAELAAVEAELPPHLRPLLRVAHITGWRRGELLSRRWRHVDFEDGWIRLDPGETKSGEGRMFPMIPQLRAILEAQLARKQSIERETGQLVTALFFHENGHPVKDFRRQWTKACTNAGHPDRIFHDFRRTAARNLIRAGVPQRVAMELTGHLTANIFQRYAIVDETMLTEAAAKLASHLNGDVTPVRQVLPLR